MAKQEGGVSVPGGVVQVEPHGRSDPLSLFIKSMGVTVSTGGFSTRGLARDIVIRDSEDGREVYREGPYDGITVGRQCNRLIEEVRATGLDDFLRSKHLEAGRVGPISAPSQWIDVPRLVVATYLRATRTAITRRLPGRHRSP